MVPLPVNGSITLSFLFVIALIYLIGNSTGNLAGCKDVSSPLVSGAMLTIEPSSFFCNISPADVSDMVPSFSLLVVFVLNRLVLFSSSLLLLLFLLLLT